MASEFISSSAPAIESERQCAALMDRVAELEANLARLTRQQSTLENDDATQALRDSEERFRLLAENSTDMISRHAPDGSYLYVSPACQTLLGLEPAQVIGHNAYEFIAAEDHAVVHQIHDLQLSSGQSKIYTYRLCHSDGQRVWVESTTRCVLDKQGHVQEIHVSTRDISARTAAQQALAKSEEEYRSLIECASDIIFRLNPHFRILFVNRALPQAAREILLGSDFLDHIAPDHKPQARQLLKQVFELNEPASAELEVIPVTCHNPWYAFRFAPIQENGKTVAATVIGTNISQRKETEQALLLARSAIENVQDAVVITSAGLLPPGPLIVYVNHAYEKMTGYSAAEVLGKSPRILSGPRTDPKVIARLSKNLRANEVFHGEAINYRKDNSEFVLEWDIAPIRDAQGNTINYVSIQRDITESRQREQAASHHQAELAHVGRLSMMGEMASGLAHELNQPLTAITNYTRGCLRKLQDSPHADPKIAQAIELAALQADRAGQIIRRLRQFIRKRVPQHSPVAINSVVHDALTLMAGEIRQYQINLQLELTEDLPMVKADNIQIEQVLLNLLRNAFESIANLPANDRKVTLYTRTHQQGVRISVMDNGPGMDHETCLRIFEPFFTTKNRGLGMGLPICLSIIESHSGRLWADDRQNHGDDFFPPGPGGLFHFWLPQITPDDLIKSEQSTENVDYFQ